MLFVDKMHLKRMKHKELLIQAITLPLQGKNKVIA
jgi:hypothetical protein